jgi:DnaK suppressor protein
MSTQTGGQDERCWLKALLEERRHEILERVQGMSAASETTGEVMDLEDQAVDDVTRELHFAVAELRSQTLHRIDEAIERLATPRHGLCDECGTPIDPARLRALPFALSCHDCQRRREEHASAPSRGRSVRRRRSAAVPHNRGGRLWR